MIASILVVDDDPGVRSMLQDFLGSKGHRVLLATDGAQAFAVAEKERPHLIIMDVVMGGVYGSTATKRLQDCPDTAGIPILIMSGSVDKKVLGSLGERPNVRFMKKPFQLDELEKTVREMLPLGGYTR